MKPEPPVAIPLSRGILNAMVDPSTGTGTATALPVLGTDPTACVPFHLPSSFDVGGILANGTVSVSFSPSGGSSAVTCTFVGGSSIAYPTDPLDIERGRTATFESCSDGQPVTALRCGTNLSMNVQAPVGLPVAAQLQLDDQSCGNQFELLTPFQTKSMHDLFSWPNPGLGLSQLPLVAETNPPMTGSPQSTPALYYAWVYIQSAQDILNLRKFYVHMLSMPLFDQEVTPFTGKCGMFSNPGDGQGQFIPVVIPGLVYNTILKASNTQFQNSNMITPGKPPFDAIILRTDMPAGATLANGSLNPVLLAQSNFHYLDYEPVPLPSQSDMKLSAGNVQAAFQDLIGFIVDTVQDIGKAVQEGIGAIDQLFNGTANLTVKLYAGNMNPQFGRSVDPLVEAWGPNAGQPLGIGGLSVTIYEHKLFSEAFSGNTDSTGTTVIQAAKGDNTQPSVCIRMNTNTVRFSEFLWTTNVCDFTNTGPGGVPQGSPTPNFPFSDTNHDQTEPLVIGNPQFAMLYEMADAARWSTDVGGFPPDTANVLYGPMADAITGFSNHRAVTFGLHYRNVATSYADPVASLFEDLTTLVLTGAGATAGTVIAGPGGGTTGGAAAGAAIGLTADVIANYFQVADILMPTASATNQVGAAGREIGSHEYGHFLLEDMAQHQSFTAIDSMVISSVASFLAHGNNTQDPVRYINEAFADFVSGQVTSIANYKWVVNQPDPLHHVCGASVPNIPCYDANYTGSPTFATDNAGIGRIASLIEDVFDGHPDEFASGSPDDADSWIENDGVKVSVPGFGPEPTFTFGQKVVSWGSSDTSVTFGCRQGTGGATLASDNCIGGEQVALPGSAFEDLGKSIEHFATDLSLDTGWINDKQLYSAVDRTMADFGRNWCDRCAVLALHNPSLGNAGADGLSAQGLLQQCLNDPFFAGNGLPSGSPPDPDLRLEVSTCAPCQAGFVSNDSGHCVQCPHTVVGNSCNTCQPSVTIDLSTTPVPFSQSFDLSSVAASPNCPGWFWVEIDNAAAPFTHPNVTLSSSLFVASCSGSAELVYDDKSFNVIQDQIDTLSQSGQAGQSLVVCNGQPSVTIASASALPSSTIFFGTPIVPGTSLNLNVTIPITPPR